MVSSGKVSCIVFVMHLLLRVMCVLMHVHVLVGVNVSVIMCILVWIHVCVAPPIVVGAWPMAGTLWRLFEYYLFIYFVILLVSLAPRPLPKEGSIYCLRMREMFPYTTVKLFGLKHGVRVRV